MNRNGLIPKLPNIPITILKSLISKFNATVLQSVLLCQILLSTVYIDFWILDAHGGYRQARLELPFGTIWWHVILHIQEFEEAFFTLRIHVSWALPSYDPVCVCLYDCTQQMSILIVCVCVCGPECDECMLSERVWLKHTATCNKTRYMNNYMQVYREIRERAD